MNSCQFSVSEYPNLIRKDYWLQQQENFKIKGNFTNVVGQPDVQALEPKNIRDINTVDKINDWDQRNQRSLSTNTDADSDSLTQNVRDCNLNVTPLNKRYEFHCARRVPELPSVSATETENLNNNSSSTNESVQSLRSTEPSCTRLERFEIKKSKALTKALEQESV